MRVVVRPKENRIWIDHAFRPGQEKDESAARAFHIIGCREMPTVEVNGRPLKDKPGTVKTAEGEAYVIPLEHGL